MFHAVFWCNIYLCLWLHVTLEGARAALSLAGTMLGYYPVRVLPSKTAIAPVNPTFLPRVRKPCIFMTVHISFIPLHLWKPSMHGFLYFVSVDV